MTDGVFYGKFKGFVRDASDSEGRGRLRLFVPEVLGSVDDDSHWTDWAEPCLPWFATGGIGSSIIPPVAGGWGVWVEFRQGDIRFPIWIGVFPLDSTTLDESKLQLEATTINLVANAVNVGDGVGHQPVHKATSYDSAFDTFVAAVAAAMGTITSGAPAGGAPAGTAITTALTTFQAARTPTLSQITKVL